MNKALCICLLFYGFFGVSQAEAAEPVVLLDSDRELRLGSHLDYFEDEEGLLTLMDVMRPEVANRFSPYEFDTPNFGFTNSAYWFSFQLWRDAATETTRLLEVGYPILDNIEIYVYSGTELTETFRLGDKLKFSERPIEHRNFIVPIVFEPYERKRILMRVSTSTSFKVPISLWPDKLFYAEGFSSVAVYGAYFGLMFVMALYNLFVFFGTRDRAYLLYVGWVVTFALAQASLIGFSFQYLWPDNLWLAEKSFPLLAATMGVFTCLFANEFLHLRDHARKHYRVSCSLAGLATTVVIATPFLPYAMVTKVMPVMALLAIPTLLSAGILRWRQGSVEARYYTIAWVSLLVGFMIFSLSTLGLVPVSAISTHGALIGSALEVILLSLALARKLKSLHERTEVLAKDLILKSKELVVALDLAQAADTLKGEILANLSHELRTPLNALINVPKMLSEKIRAVPHYYCESCSSTFEGDGEVDKEAKVACPECGLMLRAYSQFESETEPEEVVALLTQTARSGVHLAKTISDMLEFAKLESGSTVVSKRSIASRKLLDEVTTKLLAFAVEKDVGISVELPADTHLSVDGEKIDLLFQKLIENAIEFSPPETSVLVTGAKVREGEALRISVRDDGPGIASVDQDVIFESFRQVEGGHTRSHPGVGLGLSIASSIAKAHGSRIEVDSEPGKGSTFSVELPLDFEKAS